MISRRRHGLALLLSIAVVGPAVAAAQPPVQAEASLLRVVVRVCNERDVRALSRLRGQTSDLRVALIVREDDTLEPQFGQQLDRATALGVELGASAVVWFDSLPAGAEGAAPLLVYVATPDSGRVLARQLGTVPSDDGVAPPESALLEQSALVVRFALEGLAVGGAIGVERAAEPAPQTAAVSEPEPAPAPPIVEPAAQSARLVWLGLGYQSTVDGLAPFAHHGLAVRLEVSSPRFQASIASSVSLPTTHHEARADLRLQRVGAGAGVAAVWPLSTRWSLSGGGQVGIMAQRRETIGSATDVAARPARWTAALAFGPELRVRYRVGTFGVGLGAVLDVLPAPPRFVYRQGELEIEGEQAWIVQPRLILSGEVAP